MDQAELKVGLARQFIKKSEILAEETMDNFVKNRPKNIYSNRSWQRILDYFNDATKNCAIHMSKFGSNKNPCLGLTYLRSHNYNDEKNWDENLLFSSAIYFSKNPFDIETKNGFNFELSMHVFERIFERHSNKDMRDFKVAFEVIKNELKFLTIISCVFNYYFNYLNKEEKNLFKNNNYFIIPVPSPEGVFLSHLHENNLCVRTFVSLKELTNEQKEIRDLFITTFNPYISTHLPYLFQSILRNDTNVLIKFEWALLFSVILLDLKPLIKKISLSMFIDNLSDKIEVNSKNINEKWSKFIFNRIEPLTRELVPVEGYIDENRLNIRKDAEEGNLLESMKKLKIKFGSRRFN